MSPPLPPPPHPHPHPHTQTTPLHSATNGLDCTRRINLLGFCQSTEHLHEAVEAAVVRRGGEVFEAERHLSRWGVGGWGGWQGVGVGGLVVRWGRAAGQRAWCGRAPRAHAPPPPHPTPPHPPPPPPPHHRSGVHERLRMAVAIPLLWGVPPEYERLHRSIQTAGGIIDRVYREWHIL